MKTFEERVEEIYQDADLRAEFFQYARLKAAHRNQIKQAKEKDPPSSKSEFLSYDAITATRPHLSPEAIALNRGLVYLASSLFKTLSQRYPLAPAEVQRIREAVADRYGYKL